MTPDFVSNMDKSGVNRDEFSLPPTPGTEQPRPHQAAKALQLGRTVLVDGHLQHLDRLIEDIIQLAIEFGDVLDLEPAH